MTGFVWAAVRRAVSLIVAVHRLMLNRHPLIVAGDRLALFTQRHFPTIVTALNGLIVPIIWLFGPNHARRAIVIAAVILSADQQSSGFRLVVVACTGCGLLPSIKQSSQPWLRLRRLEGGRLIGVFS